MQLRFCYEILQSNNNILLQRVGSRIPGKTYESSRSCILLSRKFVNSQESLTKSLALLLTNKQNESSILLKKKRAETNWDTAQPQIPSWDYTLRSHQVYVEQTTTHQWLKRTELKNKLNTSYVQHKIKACSPEITKLKLMFLYAMLTQNVDSVSNFRNDWPSCFGLFWNKCRTNKKS